jgi:Tfp pilus assembly PilM family ATPase
MLFRRTSPPPIGLHFGCDAVRLLQLRGSADGSFAIQAAASSPLPLDEQTDMVRRITAAGGTIRRLLGSGDFRGREVVAALPRELVHLRTLRLPPMPDADVAWAVQADARDVFLFDTAKARLQFIDAGEMRQGGEPGREIIMAAAGEALIDEFVRGLDAAGAVVRSLDIEPCALHRALRFGATADAGGVQATLHVGDARSHFLLAKGERLRVIRVIDAGSRHFGDADALDVIVRETRLALRHHAEVFGDLQPAQLGLIGETAADRRFRIALVSAAVPPITLVDPFMGIDTSSLDGSVHRWTVALGLALRSTRGPQGTTSKLGKTVTVDA